MSISLPLTNWTDHPERTEVFDAHLALTVGMLRTLSPQPVNTLHVTECTRMLDESLWAVTEVKPTPRYKGDQRYVSEGVKALFESYAAVTAQGKQWSYLGPNTKWHGRNDPRRCLKHEHVIPRKFLRQALVQAADNQVEIERILRSAFCCLVTQQEDQILTAADNGVTEQPHGWERYQRAQVRVWDRMEGIWVN